MGPAGLRHHAAHQINHQASGHRTASGGRITLGGRIASGPKAARPANSHSSGDGRVSSRRVVDRRSSGGSPTGPHQVAHRVASGCPPGEEIWLDQPALTHAWPVFRRRISTTCGGLAVHWAHWAAAVPPTGPPAVPQSGRLPCRSVPLTGSPTGPQSGRSPRWFARCAAVGSCTRVVPVLLAGLSAVWQSGRLPCRSRTAHWFAHRAAVGPSSGPRSDRPPGRTRGRSYIARRGGASGVAPPSVRSSRVSGQRVPSSLRRRSL
ncbi:hypothetical protein SAMN05444920_1021051 [Nonomuraea solani]|uniref:Uncharacterized protein n=1 Tax=Nonomuraea solani TaxID=1144553 RepID=A0A1H6A7B6_9ACTN|nr:hypothetical protein SAMN05444920_1021051 [Nonomuraea solani]